MEYQVPLEIERKFLVKRALLPDLDEGVHIVQAYLYTGNDKTIRLRITENQGILTIKGPTVGESRPEFEYEIPSGDAKFMFENYCGEGRIEKIRREIQWAGKTWEVDEFLGDNTGLWLAEIEMDEAGEILDLPPWIDAEVTADGRYRNSNLAILPYTRWKL